MFSQVPPCLNGPVYDGCYKIDEVSGWGVLGCYYVLFTEIDESVHLYGNGIDAVLYIPDDVYDTYKNDNDWNANFSIIAKIGAGSTLPPSIIARGFNQDNNYYGYQLADSMYIYFEQGEESTIYVGNTAVGRFEKCGTNWHQYQSGRWFPDTYYSWMNSNHGIDLYIYAYAISEGKAPSPIIVASELYYSPESIIIDDEISEVDLPYLMSEEYNDEIDGLFYHSKKDGIYYRMLNDTSLEVVSGMINHCKIHHFTFGAPHPHYNNEYDDSYYYEDSVELLNYKGHVIIPNYACGESSVPFINPDVAGQVISIKKNAFKGCTELLSVTIPNSVDSIGDNAFSQCEEIQNILMPTSIRCMGNNCFKESSINSLHLYGDGPWSGEALDVPVQRFDLASAITAIPGMKVNPREVYCYSKVPPTCDENTFTDYTGTLHVPESSLAAYFTAPYWCYFLNIVGDAVELQNFSINRDSTELLIGEQINLNATLQPTNASVGAIQWQSSNPSIALVTSDGVVTANALGECDIIATCFDKQATCHVKVVEQIVTITLDLHHASLLPNHILTLTPTVTPAPTPLAVTSSNPSVAAARLANGAVQVVGISPGTSVIKVSSADETAFADSCLVNVYTEVGDLDGDGFVKIDDVTTMIDYLLSGDSSTIDTTNADVNHDGAVNISDVTLLIDHLLNGTSWQSKRICYNNNSDKNNNVINLLLDNFLLKATNIYQ